MIRRRRLRLPLRVTLGAGLLVLSMPPTVPAQSTPVPGPEEDYVLHCSGCHGPDGRGTPGVVPSLDDLGPIAAFDGGREYLARVPGVAQAPLSDARLARLLNWLLERHAGAPPDPRYDAKEVGTLRSAPLRDPLAARRALGPDESL